MVSFRPIERQFHRGEHNRQSFCSVWVPFHYHPVVWGHLGPLGDSLWFEVCRGCNLVDFSCYAP